MQASLSPGPIGKTEHTSEELVSVLKAKGCVLNPRLEAALLLIPRDIFVPRDRHREAFRDQKVRAGPKEGRIGTSLLAVVLGFASSSSKGSISAEI